MLARLTIALHVHAAVYAHTGCLIAGLQGRFGYEETELPGTRKHRDANPGRGGACPAPVGALRPRTWCHPSLTAVTGSGNGNDGVTAVLWGVSSSGEYNSVRRSRLQFYLQSEHHFTQAPSAVTGFESTCTEGATSWCGVLGFVEKRVA